MPQPFSVSAARVDLSPRIQATTTVAASPAAATETNIGTLTLAGFGDLNLATGVLLNGWAAYTLGTAAASTQLRIRQTNVTGTVKADSGAMTGGHNTAGLLVADDVNGFDAAPGVATYVLTLTVASATAASTVSACFLAATII